MKGILQTKGGDVGGETIFESVAWPEKRGLLSIYVADVTKSKKLASTIPMSILGTGQSCVGHRL